MKPDESVYGRVPGRCRTAAARGRAGRWRRALLAALAVGLGAAALPGCAQQSAPAAPAEVYDHQPVIDAREAFRRKDAARLAAARAVAAAARHPLAPWVDYWDLAGRLQTAQPDEIEAFYARWRGSYVEDRLRNDWLLELGRRGDWNRARRRLPALRDERRPRGDVLRPACLARARPRRGRRRARRLVRPEGGRRGLHADGADAVPGRPPHRGRRLAQGAPGRRRQPAEGGQAGRRHPRRRRRGDGRRRGRQPGRLPGARRRAGRPRRRRPRHAGADPRRLERSRGGGAAGAALAAAAAAARSPRPPGPASASRPRSSCRPRRSTTTSAPSASSPRPARRPTGPTRRSPGARAPRCAAARRCGRTCCARSPP